ncbi:MAG: hypothetical protein ACLQOO_19080 [Terriglobia bacterium]
MSSISASRIEGIGNFVVSASVYSAAGAQRAEVPPGPPDVKGNDFWE